MKRALRLSISDWVNGEPSFSNLNVMLVFQVNCPGCFLYSLPTMIKAKPYLQSKGIFSFALSTAFEDFDKNTLNNTELLQQRGQLVGETSAMFQKMGEATLPYKLDFPIAFDRLKGEPNVPREENERMGMVPYTGGQTFFENGFQGTPTWVIFNKNFDVLLQTFGHLDEQNLINLLETHA